MRRAITLLLIISQIVLTTTSCSSRRIKSVPMVAPTIALKPEDIGSRIKIETINGKSVSGLLRSYTDSTIVYGLGSWPEDRTIAAEEVQSIYLFKANNLAAFVVPLVAGCVVFILWGMSQISFGS